MADYNLKTFVYDVRGYMGALDRIVSDVANFIATTDVREVGATKVVINKDYAVVALLWNRAGASPSASPSEGTPSSSPSEGTPSSSPSEGTPSSSPSASPSEGTPSSSPSASPSGG